MSKILLILLLLPFGLFGQGNFFWSHTAFDYCKKDSAYEMDNYQYLNDQYYQDSIAYDFVINFESSKVFILYLYNSGYPKIKQYSFTPDLSTMLSYDNISFTIPHYYIYGFEITSDGNTAYIYFSTTTSDYIQKYTMDSWDITSLSATNQTFSLDGLYSIGVSLSSNDNYLMVGTATGQSNSLPDTTLQFVVDKTDISNSFYNGMLIDDYAGFTSPTYFDFGANGYKLYISTGVSMYQYSLDIPYNLNGNITQGLRDVEPYFSYISDFTITEDGKYMYTLEIDVSPFNSTPTYFVKYEIICPK